MTIGLPGGCTGNISSTDTIKVIDTATAILLRVRQYIYHIIRNIWSCIQQGLVIFNHLITFGVERIIMCFQCCVAPLSFARYRNTRLTTGFPNGTDIEFILILGIWCIAEDMVGKLFCCFYKQILFRFSITFRKDYYIHPFIRFSCKMNIYCGQCRSGFSYKITIHVYIVTKLLHHPARSVLTGI